VVKVKRETPVRRCRYYRLRSLKKTTQRVVLHLMKTLERLNFIILTTEQ
jgi:hypothetical protein